jgi:hypothetical protein
MLSTSAVYTKLSVAAVTEVVGNAALVDNADKTHKASRPSTLHRARLRVELAVIINSGNSGDYSDHPLLLPSGARLQGFDVVGRIMGRIP